MRHRFWIATFVILSILSGIVACNYTAGDCYPRGQGDGNVDVGSGVINSTGPGNPGEQPGGSMSGSACNAPEQSSPGNNGSQGSPSGGAESGDGGGTVVFCDDPSAPECSGLPVAISAFDPSAFNFVTVVADDGKDAAGGWQHATAILAFVRLDGSEAWTCTITVGMPLRAELVGVISRAAAANVTAAIATQAWQYLRKTAPGLPPGVFCSKFKAQMHGLFSDKTTSTSLIGAQMEANP